LRRRRRSLLNIKWICKFYNLSFGGPRFPAVGSCHRKDNHIT
jgi:hypothetical protein